MPKDGSKTPNAVGGGQGFSEYKDRPVVPKRFANEDPDDMKFDGNGTLMRQRRKNCKLKSNTKKKTTNPVGLSMKQKAIQSALKEQESIQANNVKSSKY